MARKSPALVQVTCSTTGSGPYTLTNTTPGAGYRSIANAVADGSIANGDEILYFMRDSAALGTGKLFERGKGTLNTSTLVLTVTGIFERSAALVSGGGWGAGTRDVLIAPPGVESVAALDVANEFTANQTVSGVTPILQLSSAGTVRSRILYTANLTIIDYLSSLSAVQGRIQIGNGTLEFYNGAITRNIAVIEAGLKVVQLAGGNVNKVPWYQAASPTGWVKDTSQNDKAMRVVSGAGGVSGGSRALSSATVGGTSLSTNQLNSHSHTVQYSTVNVEGFMPSNPVSVIATLGSGGSSGNTSSVGADTTHDHALALAYIDLIICSLT